jgi:PIN domain nuclease of toxin-antitoxin system
MRVLVDANALIWAVDKPSNLSVAAASVLQDPANQLFISAATIWEISIKVGLKKLWLSLAYKQWINQAISDLQMSVLAITADHADAQISLPMHHKDPFDRLLIAQAQVETLSIVSSDQTLDRYGVQRLWD